ncbi:cysteine-rich CWC family protein [Vibrio sp.]|uniref:cysteine-rich CWC family protein n=1 Tax=Vibrio sp. TaxID=678 RepID=UPI00311D939E
MKTPCIAACKNNGGICSGCHRTMDEVIGWKALSDSNRDEIIDELSGDTSDHICPSCNGSASCDLAQGKKTCWCFSLEKRILPTEFSSNLCLCRKCLSKLEIA